MRASGSADIWLIQLLPQCSDLYLKTLGSNHLCCYWQFDLVLLYGSILKKTYATRMDSMAENILDRGSHVKPKTMIYYLIIHGSVYMSRFRVHVTVTAGHNYYLKVQVPLSGL